MSRHPDFKTTEASRPDWDATSVQFTKTADPDWKFGDGANHLDKGASATKKHIAIDPYEPGRPATSNYKLLISAITPRPIGFVSTRSGPPASGNQHDATTETLNLAPFSYFNVVASDPPLFVLGITTPLSRPKDTLRNLVENGECTVNIISEHYIEAANSTCMDVPSSRSEWVVSGLTPVHDVQTVSTPRVREAVFTAECRVESIREFESRVTPGQKSACVVTVEAQRFWVREDALNEEKSLISFDALRPMSRLGGISYGRIVQAMELPRPVFERDLGVEKYDALAKKADGAAN
ncbi:FMN-binding split barrel [Xylaria intraflava]|nr:FMN-binding split barrel [Xylaria intraflava]